MEGLISHAGTSLVGRQELLALPEPVGTATHKPVAHATIVQLLIESLALRNLEVVRDEYAVTEDGQRVFGVLEVNREDSGVRFAIGLRNAHDKSFSLGLTVGFRVFVCDNLAFHGDFQPITRKHTAKFDPMEVIDIGVTRMQRHFEPMKKQLDVWRGYNLTDQRAKNAIYAAFIEGQLAVPRRLAREVHTNYFHSDVEEFQQRTMWSLSNAFTSAFKLLDPIPRFQATAKLAPFLTACN